MLVDKFLAAVTDPKNQPCLHSLRERESRRRVMWMVKRMVVDKWDAERVDGAAALWE